MKRTKMTGKTGVGEIRLAPIDIGFDPRLLGISVMLPRRFRSVGIEENGEVYLIEGTVDEMAEAIQNAGYSIGGWYDEKEAS